MAKKTSLKETAAKTTEEPKPPDEPKKIDWLSLAVRVLPAVGIIAALLYFLGRLRTEAYYQHLGINPYVLNFTTEDYMFSSFNLALMLVVIVIVTFLMRIIYEPTYQIGFDLEQFKKLEDDKAAAEHYFESHVSPMLRALLYGTYTETFSKYIVPLGLSIYLTYVFITEATLAEWPRGVLGSLLGVTIGMIFGYIVILYTFYMRFEEGIEKLKTIEVYLPKYMKEKITKKTRKRKSIETPRKTRFLVYVAALIVILIVFTPFIAEAVGKSEAVYDLHRSFPDVIIHSNDQLPESLQEIISEPTVSKEVKLITTNNGMTYVIDREDESSDKWQVYAIPEESISQIVYLHEGQKDKGDH